MAQPHTGKEKKGKKRQPNTIHAGKENKPMFGLIPWKTKHAKRASGNGGALAPFNDFPVTLNRMREEFDKLYEKFGLEMQGPLSLAPGNRWRWGLEIVDEEKAVVVRAEAPGFEPADFDLQIRNNELILKASKKAEKGEKGGKNYEWSQAECYQSITLPSGIDTEKVEAKYHSGLLTVKFPKTAEGMGKRIPVKSNGH
jgi:HSP20 family protein